MTPFHTTMPMPPMASCASLPPEKPFNRANGATGSFLAGIAALGESANVWRIACAALTVLGVCGLRFISIK